MKSGLTDKQKQMLAYGEAHPYSLLCADPRLGKSRVAILLAKKRKVPCLIICPSYLISNWKKEILKWWPTAQVTTFRAAKQIYEPFDSDFVVTSYDLIRKAEFLFDWWAKMTVWDEIHAVKNMASIRSQFLHRVLYENSLPYFHGLTGTPLKNRVKEFYSLIALASYNPKKTDQKFLDTFPDEITFADKFSFSKSYKVKVQKGKKKFKIQITNYYGLKNEKELRTWLKGKYIRIRADKNDLPPISYLDTLVSDIDNKDLLKSFNAYFADEREIREAIKEGDITEAEAREMRTGSVLPEHKRNAAMQKVPFTIKYVENLLESVECCLIYTDHVEACKQIADHFKVPAITGKMSATRRGQLVHDFQASKLNIICATIGSLKEGADLFRSKDVVINDPTWVPGDILQVINRTRALGEKEPRTVHRILGSPQDEKIWGALLEKTKTIDKAT